MYCGNNRNDPDVVVGAKVLGTRYACFKKGIGIGLHLPFDPAYAVPYRPVDRARIYCGTENRTPIGYTRRGSPSLCLRKGVGVGKSIRAKRPRKSRRRPRRRKSKKRKPKKRKSKKRKSKKRHKSKRKSRKRRKSKKRKKKSRRRKKKSR